MRMARCRSANGWHYDTTRALVGLVVAAVLMVLMRNDLEQGLTWAVVITSASGWTRRRTSPDNGQEVAHDDP
jgi:hypothetical protein